MGALMAGENDPWAEFRKAPVSPAADEWSDFRKPPAAPEASASAPIVDNRSTARKVFDAVFPRYGVAASVADGMTFGTLPNIQAAAEAGTDAAANLVGLGSGKPMGQVYDETLKSQQDARRAFKRDNPILSPVLEAGGGLTTGAAAVRNGATIVGNMVDRGFRNILPRMAAGATEGAGYGAVSGFGHSEGDLSERAKAAKDEALIGAIFGGAAVPAVDAVMAVGGGNIRNFATMFRDPNRRAEELLVDAIMRDGTTPRRVADDVRAAAAAGQPEFAAVDAGGRNTHRLAAMAAKTPGPFRETAAATTAARQNGQGDRIGRFVDEALGEGGTAYRTEQELLAGRRAAAAGLYDQAYQAPPPRGAVYDDMMGRQSVADAMRAAERTAAERQMPISDLFVEVPNPNARVVQREVPSNVLGADGRPIMRVETETENPTIRIPTMRGWDFIKRELDARVNQLYSAGDTTAAQAVQETRNALRGQLATDNEAYGRALARYSDDSAALDAIETGRTLANARNADEARVAFGELDEGQRALARVGASREIGSRLDNMRAGQDKTLAFDTPNMQGKMDTLSPDPVVRAVFDQRLDRERAMARANRQMQGGSNTYENFADASAVTDGVLSKLSRGNVGGAAVEAAGRMLGFIGRATQGMNEDIAQRVGRYLLSASPDEIVRLTAAYEQAQRGSVDRGRFVARLLSTASAMTPSR
jgi:hypothetical protein